MAESRNGAFTDGAHGGDLIGAATHSATSIQKNVAAPFNPAASVLTAANAYSGAGLGSSSQTMSIKDPYAAAMKSELQRNATGAAAGGNGTLNV